MMDSSEDVVIIKPKKQNPAIIIGVLIVFLIQIYFRFQEVSQHPTASLYWVRFVFTLFIWLLLVGSFAYRRKNPQGILKLTPLGLNKGKTSYRWHEIEQFGITGAKAGSISSLIGKVVFWNFKETSPSRRFIHKASKVFSGYDEGVLARNYEISAEDLVKLLNDRKIRYTGQPSEIQYQGGSGRTQSKVEMNPVQKKLVLFNLIVIISVAGYFSYGYVRAKMVLNNTHGADFITIDTQDRLYFFYQGNVYRLGLKDDSLVKLIETSVELASGDIMGIAVSSSGNIFLTNPKTREVNVYSPSGEFVRRLEGHFKENAKIAVDDKRIYLADMQGNRVVALDPEVGNILWMDKGYLMPDSLDVRDNIVYVSDKDTKSVRMLSTSDGHLINKLTLDFSGYTYGSTILSIPNHELLLVQAYSRDGHLQRYSGNGKLLQTIRGPDGFSPAGLAVTSTGDIVVSDDSNYLLYLVKGSLVSPLQSAYLNKLFESDLNKKVALERSSQTFRMVLIFCLVWLIGTLVYYKRSSGSAPHA